MNKSKTNDPLKIKATICLLFDMAIYVLVYGPVFEWAYVMCPFRI